MSLSLFNNKEREREKDVRSVYNKRRAVIKTFAQQQQKKTTETASRALFEVQDTPLEVFLLKKRNEISKI